MNKSIKNLKIFHNYADVQNKYKRRKCMGINIGKSNTSPENYIKIQENAKNFDEAKNQAVNDTQADTFSMFDYNQDSYGSDLVTFSQSYIDQFDTEEKDGVLNRIEFLSMAGGENISEENIDLYNLMFDRLNIDNDFDTITAEEYASIMYSIDSNDEKTDGKINFSMYDDTFNTLLSDEDPTKEMRTAFYNAIQEQKTLEQTTKTENMAAEENDEYGRVTKSTITNDDGTQTITTYQYLKNNAKIIEETITDTNGKAISITGHQENNSGAVVNDYNYTLNDNGEIIAKDGIWYGSKGEFDCQYTFTYEFDENGNRIGANLIKKDQQGNLRHDFTIVYDPDGVTEASRTEIKTTPDGNIITSLWDNIGRCKSEVERNNNNEVIRETVYDNEASNNEYGPKVLEIINGIQVIPKVTRSTNITEGANLTDGTQEAGATEGSQEASTTDIPNNNVPIEQETKVLKQEVIGSDGDSVTQIKKTIINSNGETETKYYLSCHDYGNEGADDEEIEIDSPLGSPDAIGAMWTVKNAKIDTDLLDNISKNSNISAVDRVNILSEAMAKDTTVAKDWCNCEEPAIIGLYQYVLNEILPNKNASSDELIELKKKCEKYTTKKMKDYENYFPIIRNAIYENEVNWTKNDLEKLNKEFSIADAYKYNYADKKAIMSTVVKAGGNSTEPSDYDLSTNRACELRIMDTHNVNHPSLCDEDDIAGILSDYNCHRLKTNEAKYLLMYMSKGDSNSLYKFFNDYQNSSKFAMKSDFSTLYKILLSS